MSYVLFSVFDVADAQFATMTYKIYLCYRAYKHDLRKNMLRGVGLV